MSLRPCAGKSVVRSSSACHTSGYYPNPKEGEVGDTQVAAQVDGIDFIASGHTRIPS